MLQCFDICGYLCMSVSCLWSRFTLMFVLVWGGVHVCLLSFVCCLSVCSPVFWFSCLMKRAAPVRLLRAIRFSGVPIGCGRVFLDRCLVNIQVRSIGFID